jgi:hypothetical protein
MFLFVSHIASLDLVPLIQMNPNRIHNRIYNIRIYIVRD